MKDREYLKKYLIKSSVEVPITLIAPIESNYSQGFGYNFMWQGKNFYEQWGLNGHNGLDFGCKIGTEIYAPCNLYVDKYVENETYGNTLWAYSKEWEVDGETYRLEMNFAHLKDVLIEGQHVMRGVHIAISGNSGYPVTSTAPHLHWGVRVQKLDKRSIKWETVDFDNGYRGYFNQYLIMQDMFKLIKLENCNDIYAVDELSNTKHKICNESTLKQGHITGLWDMEDIEGLPTVATYKDGSEIMLTYMD